MKGPMLTSLILLVVCSVAQASDFDPFPRPQTPLDLQGYRAHATSQPPEIDGRLDDSAWISAPWSTPFVDIEGELREVPRHHTAMKMIWDEDALYVAARLEEPDLWATLTERDAVIYHDNDFEIFLDPDGDNHLYYELEVNALNTVWDLLLIKPYRDGGPAVHAWDIAGLRSAVHCEGTLNDPSDRDVQWSVEIAIPWAVLNECSGTAAVPPRDGDRWRVNFSRVQWDLEVVDGAYRKLDRPEHNWVWSPQGLIAMHYPERWGVVEFSTDPPAPEDEPPAAGGIEYAAAALMHLYYEQRDYERRCGRFAVEVGELDLDLEGSGIRSEGFDWPPTLRSDGRRFQARLVIGDHGSLQVNESGRLSRP